jgi:hypothetical protein
MHHRGRAILSAISLLFCSQAGAAETFPWAGGKLAASQISPEATKPLPPQSTENLMPLHVASVLSWLCGDSTVQNALSTSKAGCYREFWPFASACTTELQPQAPAAETRQPGARVDSVIEFRATYRQCLAQKFAEKQSARGLAAPSLAQGEPDPLAVRTGRATSN